MALAYFVKEMNSNATLFHYDYCQQLCLASDLLEICYFCVYDCISYAENFPFSPPLNHLHVSY